MARRMMEGSQAVASAVALCRPQVISAYPITPNVLVLEAIQKLIEREELGADSINAESELGAMNVCAGAAAVGCRTFTCTCAQGVALMKEVLWMASGMALPVVIADTSRAIGSPQTFDADFSDSLSERDASFLQFYCESSQESLDSILMAYKICEDSRVLLPSFVVLEGFRISHTYELVDVPEQEVVDAFLPPYRPKHGFIDPNYPISLGLATFSDYMESKYQQYEAMQRAKDVVVEVYREFAERFGRSYGNGLIETYRIEDADLVLVTMGTMAGIARDAVDNLRQQGVRVGLLKLRCFRPFPDEDIQEALSGAKKVLVLDRACSPGSRGGITYTEICAALRRSPALVSNHIVGSRDIFQKDIEMLAEVALEEDQEFVRWYNLNFKSQAAQVSGYENYRKLVASQHVERQTVQEGEDILGQGNPFCPGCGGLVAVRNASRAFGKDTVTSMNCGCLGAMAIFPMTSWKVPYVMFTFSHAGGGFSGV
ncbi:MAG: transketolase C-terminal domain-containing protein, partial [Dehalococcoidia bacterium]|nr:transketolase C-terminal domain-containing protein [Dehalococcoidia bacterium]